MSAITLAGLLDPSLLGYVLAAAAGATLPAAACLTRRHLVARWRPAVRATQQDAQIEELRDEVWELKEAAAARERAEAASEAKSRFLATVSHEIRTPLSGILGLADLLAGGPLDAEQRGYVEAIKTSGRALASLIHEILDFSKIEAGKIDLACEPIELTGLVEGIVELLSPRAHGKGIEIAALIGADVPHAVLGDAARLRQVLMNLAGNAVKFTDAGGVGVIVSRAGDDAIRFAVIDTGIGVSADRHARIFEEFEQGDGSSSRRHAGTGLGLAISKRLVERMKGEISLKSVEGRGSEFAFTIPLPAADAARGSAVPPQPKLAGRRVLLVARSVFEAPFIARLLVEAGAEVVRAESPGVALTALRAGSAPDMLILDCAFGETETASVASAAKAAGVGRSLILFSPFERRAFGQSSLRGFHGWLVKPVRASSLFACLLGTNPGKEGRFLRATPQVLPVRRHGLRVLLAEDDEINAMIATAMLVRLGAAVTHVRDGQTALAHALEAQQELRDPYDAIVMDVRMPGLDGRDVARRVRRAEAEIGSKPVRLVALTANSLDEDRRACLAAGYDWFLTKPVDLAALGEALQQAPLQMAQMQPSAAAQA